VRLGRTPVDRKVAIVQRRSRPLTIYRRDGEDDNPLDAGSFQSLADPRDVFVFAPREQETVVAEGQIQRPTLSARILPSTDVQVDDRFDHGGVRYTVDAKWGIPDDTSPTIYELQCSRVFE
jgi:hypothetical protein